MSVVPAQSVTPGVVGLVPAPPVTPRLISAGHTNIGKCRTCCSCRSVQVTPRLISVVHALPVTPGVVGVVPPPPVTQRLISAGHTKVVKCSTCSTRHLICGRCSTASTCHPEVDQCRSHQGWWVSYLHHLLPKISECSTCAAFYTAFFSQFVSVVSSPNTK